MQAIQLRAPGGLDHLDVVDLAAPGEPGPGESGFDAGAKK